jgi:hypothetical protein
VVIPVYNGAETIAELVVAIQAEPLSIPLEIILVNDGSADDSQTVCEALITASSIPMTLISHAKNFGEHNAVMTGLRAVHGNYVIRPLTLVKASKSNAGALRCSTCKIHATKTGRATPAISSSKNFSLSSGCPRESPPNPVAHRLFP